MPSFNDAVEKVLKHEGGFVNDPLDRGGATNFGITQKTYDKWMQKKTKNPNYKSTVEEIKNMPIGNAKAIYKEEYWDTMGGDKIKYYSVASALFDQAVNRGVVAVSEQVQQVLNLPQDGIMGKNTITALNKLNDKDFLNQFFMMAEKSYRTIVKKNPSQVKFLNGWLKRLSSLQSYTNQFLGTTTGKVTTGIGLFALMSLSFFLYLKLKKK